MQLKKRRGAHPGDQIISGAQQSHFVYQPETTSGVCTVGGVCGSHPAVSNQKNLGPPRDRWVPNNSIHPTSRRDDFWEVCVWRRSGLLSRRSLASRRMSPYSDGSDTSYGAVWYNPELQEP